jgi:hypothetical protein
MLSRVFRVIPIILGCSGAVAGGAYARGATPGYAALCGLYIAITSSGLIALFLGARQLGRFCRGSGGQVQSSRSDG